MSTVYSSNIIDIGTGLDKGWVMTCTGFLMTMLIGLGLMEIGSIRKKNSKIVWFKILLNIICTTFWWYILGFAFAFGLPNGSYLGGGKFYAGNLWGDSLYQGMNSVNPEGVPGPGYTAQYAHFVWRVTLSLIAIQIVTGMLSERITLRAVAFYNIIFNILITPFIFAWTYGFGFLVDDIGYRDFAGSFIIFGVGAFAGLAGLFLIKPRYNRYGKHPAILQAGVGGEARPFNEVRPVGGQDAHLPPVAFDKLRQEPGVSSSNDNMNSTAFSAENIAHARKRQEEEAYESFGVTDFGTLVLGTLITFISFQFFNAGGTQALQSRFHQLLSEKAFSNNILAAMGSGLFTMCMMVIFGRRRAFKDNVATISRGFVAGMVTIAAESDLYAPWAAVTIGVMGGLSYLIMSYYFNHLELDDPAEFFPMFGAPAFCGIFVAAFFNTINGIFYDNGPMGEILVWQILSMAIMVAWTVPISFATFFILKQLHILRVSLKTEVVGYDFIDIARKLDYPEDGLEKLEKVKVK